jgi:glycosyltransferase involved in cell wall biosynthesis
LALPEVPQRTGKSAGEHLRIGFFGRLDPDKGVELLLDVWPELAIGPASLAFYGDGEMKGALEAIAGEKRLASSVSFCGAYDAERDLPRLMRNTDLVVLPSREEGLALVLLEAMAHGVPFVTTNRGGTVDLADNNPDVEVCDPEPLALRRSIERIATRIRGGDISPARLQSRYKERYSYAVVAPKWVDLFLNAKEIAHSGQLVVEL